MSIIIKSGASSNTANVTSNNQVEVFTGDASNPAEVGAMRIVSENDHGDITGTAYLLSPETSDDYRLRVGIDSIFDNEAFNYAAQNTSKHKYVNTTLAMALGSGGLTTNSGSSTAINTGAYWTTYRHFPIIGSAPLYSEFLFSTLDTVATNSFVYFGAFTPTSQTAAPADGVYFQVDSTGWTGVINSASSTVSTATFTFTPNVNQAYKGVIVYGREEVEFWIDDVLYGSLPRPTGWGLPSSAMAQPATIQHRITGTAAGTIWRMKFWNYTVSVGDINTNRPWASQQAGMGLSAIQGASGHTQGQTANYANSAAPASATLSNTAAGYTTLGGQFQFAAVAGAETDYALFGFLNTAPTTAITGRNLVIRGVWIDTYNMGAAVASTPTLLQWALGVGSTAVSLATAEAATTRAPRRILLGTQSLAVGAAIGANADRRIDVNLDAPVVVEPNTYCHIILKMPVGTATASQIIRGVVGVNAYWE